MHLCSRDGLWCLELWGELEGSLVRRCRRFIVVA